MNMSESHQNSFKHNTVILSQLHAMYFGSIHCDSLPNSSQISYTPYHFCVLSFLITHKVQIVLSIFPEWGYSLKSSDLPGDIPLKKTDSLSPQSCSLSIAPLLGVGGRIMNPATFNARMLTGLVLTSV